MMLAWPNLRAGKEKKELSLISIALLAVQISPLSIILHVLHRKLFAEMETAYYQAINVPTVQLTIL